MKSVPDLSIIIPAFNEEDRLPKYLDSILEYFAPFNTLYEILVVDDGSTDSTPAIVERYAALHPQIQLVRLSRNCGKGCAVKAGMLRATGRLRLFADADGATPINELERLRKYTDEGCDIVIASRALKDNTCTVIAHVHRKFLGTIFNWIVRTLLVENIYDTQCGFKLFTEEAAKAIFPLLRIDGFGFDAELLFISCTNGYRIKEVPINWSDIPTSRVKLLRDSWRMFTDVLRIRLNYSRGVYAQIQNKIQS